MRTTHAVAIAVILAAAAGAGGYWLGRDRATPATQASPAPSSDPAATTDSGGRRILYWHDPMYPQQKFDKAGKSPFMDMQLVPVYAEEAGDEGKVTINPRLQQNLGVRTAEVSKGPSAQKVEAVGSVAFNERDVALVTARAAGFIEKLYVRAPLDPVRAGQPLAQILAPDWVAAQEEYLALARTRAPEAEALRQAARQRLTVLGMPEAVIQVVERDGKPHPRVTLTAPISGVVGELTAREGMTAVMGAPLFRINGLATVWVNAKVPEVQAAWVKPGAAVEASIAAYRGEIFKGQVSALLPEVDPATRTLTARIELANPKGILKPGMFATINLAATSKKEALLVPSEAVIHTGQRNVVILALDQGKFQPVDIETGMEIDGMTEIRKGLQAGQKVVVSSQFLIDSEASLRSTSTRMSDMPTSEAGRTTHHGEGGEQ